MDYDISEYTFDELVNFYFSHPAIVYGNSSSWYLEASVIYEPTNNANFFIKLFSEPQFLLQAFRRSQLDGGFWALGAHGFEGNALHIMVEDDDIPMPLREDVIRANYDLWEKLFAVDEIGESSAFWWRRIGSYFSSGSLRNERTPRLADVIFETLLRVLRLNSLYCQYCALDGLENLRHMSTAPELKWFLRKQRKIDKQLKKNIIRLIENNPL